MRPSLSLPCKPFNVTQGWNNPNPMYAGFNFKNHNGIDFMRFLDEKTWAIYCPSDGFTVTKVHQDLTNPKGALPTGGGNQIDLLSDTIFDEYGLQYRLRMYFCHAEYIFAKDGDKPQEGEILLMADNTGFSTGPHTHWGCYRVHPVTLEKLDQNDANGSCNPMDYYNHTFAQDGISLGVLLKNVVKYYQYYKNKK